MTRAEELIDKLRQCVRVGIEPYECFQVPSQLVTDIATELSETPKWISVEDELPESHLAVLVWCPDRKNIFCACYSAENKAWTLFGSFGYPVYEKVTHWANVPMHP